MLPSTLYPPALFQESVVVLQKVCSQGNRIVRPLHCACAVCFRSIALCVQIRAYSHVCVVCFGGGGCVSAVSAVAARHGDSEGVCVLQLHLVLL